MKSVIYSFMTNTGSIVSGTFYDISQEEFDKRIIELGYLKPKWYQFWKQKIEVYKFY